MANSKIVKYYHKNKKGFLIEMPNLYLDEITGTFFIRVYHQGRTRTRSLKTKSFLVAKSRMAETKKEILENSGKKKGNKLVRDFYLDLIKLKESEGLSDRTMVIYSNSWRNHIEPYWGNFTPEDITKEAYTAFLVWHKKNKGGLLFNPLKLLRSLVALMADDGALIKPIKIYTPKKERDSSKQSKGTYISKSEIARIMDAAVDERISLMIDLAYSFGFRIGELTNLKRRAVRSKNGVCEISLGVKDTKTRSPRVVPLNKRLSEKLTLFMKTTTGPYVFPMKRDEKRPVAKQVIDKAWLRTLKDAGIKRRIRFHDLRHTCATNFANLDLNETKACAVLGMSLNIYSSIYVKRESLDLSSIVDAVTHGENHD